MNKLKWLVNRLRQMSLSEVLFRLKRSFEQKREKRKVLSGWQPFPKNIVSANASLFGTDLEIVSTWNANHALDNNHLDNYMAGKIDFFGNEPLATGHPVKWHTDPVTQIVSPMEFGKSLDYRNDKKVGNVKFIWELGRHQHLVSMAVAYAVTGDLKYREAVATQIDSWIESNPFGMGIHWCSSLEVALRLISWSLVHSFIAIRDGDNGLFGAVLYAEKLGNSIYQQSYFIRHFLSLHSSANNHLIGELTGLWAACQTFDLGDDGQQWSDFTYAEIERQAEFQVYADGVSKEQAFYYHLWVLEYFIFAWLIGSNTNKPFSQNFCHTIEKMSAFIQSLSPENGNPPQVGDADDGSVARFDPFWPSQPYKEITATVDLLSGREAGYFTQKVFWYEAIMQNSAQNIKLDAQWKRQYPEIFKEGGYGILGDQYNHVVFDGGALGYLGIAAHGHADALSFCLAIDGDWWLVDPGTYAYHSKQEWRDYFRGTSAHNTIKINNEDQSIICGPFMWSHKANAEIEECNVENGIQIISAKHDGYKRIGVSHQRDILFIEKSKEWHVNDKVECAEKVKAEIFFHFSPEVSLEYNKNEGHWVVKHENSSKQLIFILDNIWNVEVIKGQRNPILGWYSPTLEERVASCVLHGVADVSGTINSITKILLQ